MACNVLTSSMLGGCSTSYTRRHAWAHVCCRPSWKVTRANAPKATAYEDPQVAPPPFPPPPPPPPPPPQPQNRRNLLIAAGGVAAGAAAIALGVSTSSSNDAEGLSGADRVAIDNLRDEGGFRRNYDGHVVLLSRQGVPVEVRLDAKMPGTVLLRDQQGYVYFITFNNVQQVDLTDDFVVMALFGDGAWEDSMQRLQVKDDSGALVDLNLNKDAFRDIISVLD